MKPLRIRIPMTEPLEMVLRHEFPPRERAAYEELVWLIPGLKSLKGSIPGLGTQAEGDQVYLCLILLPYPQLQLRLSDNLKKLGRVVELDPQTLDQKALKDCLLLTRALFADAAAQVPESIGHVVELLSQRSRSREANRLRRALGVRFAVDLFDEREVVQIPLVPATSTESDARCLSVRVLNMDLGDSFEGNYLAEVIDGQPSPHGFCKQVWSFTRRGNARTYSSGQIIHAAMELKRPLILWGAFVIHARTERPVAVEVDRVQFPGNSNGNGESTTSATGNK